MKILIAEAKERHKNFFNKTLQGHELIYWTGIVDETNAHELNDIEVLSVFIYSRITKSVIEKMPNLKLIATRSTGYDHIDLEACKERNIIVSNVPYYGENTVAEHAFGLLLNLSRNIHKSYIRTTQNNFSIEGLEGFDLEGKTLGVIGVGHIGLHMIRIAKGFGMHVLAYDKHKDKFLAQLIHYKYVDNLDELYANSDIISLHLPALPETKHIINEEAIQKMKDGVIIINTARGTLIDTDALYNGLVSGKIGGAGLDVIEGEELIKEEKEMLFNKEANAEKLKQVFKDKAIFQMENVVFTPHIGFYSREAVERIMQTTTENILAYQRGEPENIVNK